MPRADQRQDWEDLSVLDPYWAILSEPARRFGRWEAADFLRSGRDTIEAILADGARFGLPSASGDALDFGCGTGRLTLALSEHFERCVGLDISPRMIEQARTHAAGIENCRFAVHEPPDLAPLASDSFDLVVSRFVLQHVPSSDAKARYVAEFVRVLRPGGLLCLQLPSHIPAAHRLQPRPRLYALLRRAGVPAETLYRRLHLHPIRMSALPRKRVLDAIVAAGGLAAEVRDETVAGGVTSAEYIVTVDAQSHAAS